YAQGSLTFATPEATTEKEAVTGTKPTVFGDLPAAVRRIVEWRWHAIEPFAQLERPPIADELQARTDELARQGVRLSPRSLRRYWKTWFRAGGNRLALAPAVSRCGRRGRV